VIRGCIAAASVFLAMEKEHYETNQSQTMYERTAILQAPCTTPA
jgi:hypothetical protein